MERELPKDTTTRDVDVCTHSMDAVQMEKPRQKGLDSTAAPIAVPKVSVIASSGSHFQLLLASKAVLKPQEYKKSSLTSIVAGGTLWEFDVVD